MNTVTRTNKQKHLSRSDWFIVIGLILLSLVPAIAGMFRITQLSSGAEITPDNARFFASPLPVILHILSVIPYSILGAFQFSRGFRRWKISWHRMMGRILVPAGFIVALSGLWMTIFYDLPATDGELLYGMRLLFGSIMLMSIILGADAIRRKDYAEHGVWMLRAYAIAMGAGTQVITHIPYELLFGAPDVFTRAILMGAGWIINILIAEWIIRKRMTRPKRRPSVAVSAQQ